MLMQYVVGLVKEFMEIYVNKISRIPSGWSELENKILKKKTLVSEISAWPFPHLLKLENYGTPN